MSAKILTAGAQPIFLSRMYVNRDSKDNGGILVSSGDSYKHRAYDMTRESYWTSVGSNDAVIETYDARLHKGATQVSRSIDFVALMYINFKRFKVEYSDDDGATWTIFSGADYTASDFSSTDLILSLATPVTANRVKLTVTTTQTANAEKYMGEFIVALATFQPSTGFLESYDPDRPDMVKSIELGSGADDYSYLFRSDGAYEWYRANLRWTNVPTAERSSFLSIKRTQEPFLFYPEPGDLTTEIYQCRFTDFQEKYISSWKGAGWSISMKVKEVDGG